MSNRNFDGKEQEFYHDNGDFEGMAEFLQERGYVDDQEENPDTLFPDVRQLKASCKGFKCPEPPDPKLKCKPKLATRSAPLCCCSRLLYTRPYFASVPSVLETF